MIAYGEWFLLRSALYFALLGCLGDDLQGVMRFVAYLVRAQIDIKEQVG